EMKGKARASWGELTDDELTQIGGKKDQLVGKLQQKYGLEREEAERRADDWANSF
ncbi:CsbD family protein, partial [Escherichia coli]